MLHAIANEFLTVSACEMGAELQSICAADGTELLWQGDPAYWKDRGLNIFPYVARLWQGCYSLDGKQYRMPIHGFAPTSRFVLAEKTENRMAFELCSDENTYAQYPRRFVFRILYELDGHALRIAYEVKNLDAKRMYFGLGGHPGFNVPLDAGSRFEDYRLRFAQSCSPVRVGFSEDCFVCGADTAFMLEGGTTLPLRHDLFDEDAIVLRGMAREVVLEKKDGGKRIRVSFPDMPYLGIWHWPKTDAPYVCIEPWSSLPACRGSVTIFEEQADLICLEGGKTYANIWSIAVEE